MLTSSSWFGELRELLPLIAGSAPEEGTLAPIGECFFRGCDGEAGEEEGEELLTDTALFIVFALVLAGMGGDEVEGVTWGLSDMTEGRADTVGSPGAAAADPC